MEAVEFFTTERKDGTYRISLVGPDDDRLDWTCQSKEAFYEFLLHCLASLHDA